MIHNLKVNGKKVVFTNGCFDIIHKGHTTYLELARKLGDFLIIGLNSDISVTKLKGPNRPINQETIRATNLLKLDYVDAVTIFSEETPQKIIEEFKIQKDYYTNLFNELKKYNNKREAGLVLYTQNKDYYRANKKLFDIWGRVDEKMEIFRNEYSKIQGDK